MPPIEPPANELAQPVTLEALNKNYVPFPSFLDWSASTLIDQELWERQLTIVSRLKSLDESVLKRARGVATRAAAIDTGAIEGLYDVDRGFTYTVAVESGAWEAAIFAKGNEVRVMFEAQLRAYEYILDWATSTEPITEALVRTLHQEICKEQETYAVQTAVGPQNHLLPKGEYKTSPNHVMQTNGSSHSYCPVEQTAAEMARYVNELRSDEFLKATAPQQAAYAHYAFVAIHPFSDGNGRVARALASVFTYRELCAPLLVLLDNRAEYFDALAQADIGNYQAIVSFIFARACDSIELIDESVRTAKATNLRDTVSALKNIYYTPTGFTHAQIDEAALRIADQVCKQIISVADANSDKHWDVTASVVRQHPSRHYDTVGYRNLLSGDLKVLTIRVDAASVAPKAADVKAWFRIQLPEIAGTGEHILLATIAEHSLYVFDDSLKIPLEACIPNITIATEFKLRMFSERVVAQILHALLGE